MNYSAQKPKQLLRRILKISTNEYHPVTNQRSIVLDPFCGSGTALVAAKELNREFIGIDINSDAVKLSNQRLKEVSNLNQFFTR